MCANVHEQARDSRIDTLLRLRHHPPPPLAHAHMPWPAVALLWKVCVRHYMRVLYVYVCACVYTCMSICIQVCKYIHACTHMHACVCVCIQACTCLLVFVQVFIRVCVYECIVCLCVCTYRLQGKEHASD